MSILLIIKNYKTSFLYQPDDSGLNCFTDYVTIYSTTTLMNQVQWHQYLINWNFLPSQLEESKTVSSLCTKRSQEKQRYHCKIFTTQLDSIETRKYLWNTKRPQPPPDSNGYWLSRICPCFGNSKLLGNFGQPPLAATVTRKYLWNTNRPQPPPNSKGYGFFVDFKYIFCKNRFF